MEYSTFVDVIMKKINEVIDEDTVIQKECVTKNNGRKRTGLVFRTAGVNVAPAIYLEEYYDRYKDGAVVDQLVKEIVFFYHKVRVERSFNDKELKDFSFIRKRIVYQLVNYQLNEEMLTEQPHFRFYDLALCFYVLLDVKEQGILTFAITNSHLKLWKTDIRGIYRYAAENTPRLLPASFGGIDEVIREIDKDALPEEESEKKEGVCGMYILSNNIKNRGASAILYPHIMDMIGDMLQSDYYILPSSIHELIILSVDMQITKSDLKDMVHEINSTQLEAEEILSENVYFFDRKLKRILY